VSPETLEARIDPRVTRTRALLRDAMLALLPEKGFERISVSDIAERATVNRATFYAHFTDKFALLEELIRGAFRERLLAGDSIPTDDARALLRATARRVFEYVDTHRHCKLDKGSEPLFARAIEAELHLFLKDALDDASARVVSAAMVGVAMQWRTACRTVSVESMVDQIADVLVDGVKPMRAA